VLRERLFDLLRHRPFRPFRLHLTDGRRFDIVYPELNVAGRTLRMSLPETNSLDVYDEVIGVALEHIVKYAFLAPEPPDPIV
jgi:hypothetical protein